MVGISPPEYFPNLEYMGLVQHVDHFVLADTFPYRVESFHDRAKLRQSGGWHWITIPVYGNRDGAPIHTVDIETGGRWREKHWRSFLYDYRSTMYFEYFERTFRPFFETEWEALGACICHSVQVVADLFNMQTTFQRASDMNGRPSSLEDIIEGLDEREIVLPRDLAPANSRPDIELHEYLYEHPSYRQNFEGFEPGMTAADLAFNYGPEARRILGSGASLQAADSSVA